jgi:chemotaxis protein MotB
MAEGLPPIYIKKIKKCPHAPHGGAWKVAFADFMTAMMAFFLLLWLLASTDESSQKAIASYFQDPTIVETVGSGNGMGGEGQGQSNAIIDLGGVIEPVRAKNDESSTAQAAEKDQDLNALLALKAQMDQAIEREPQLQTHKDNIQITLTDQGLEVLLIDSENESLFGAGDDRLKPFAREMFEKVGQMINQLPNQIMLAGHTDARPLSKYGNTYTNWELSSDRANAARRALTTGGLDSVKLRSVKGMADRIPLDKEKPEDAKNRRISIIVLTQEAAAQLDALESKVIAVP